MNDAITNRLHLWVATISLMTLCACSDVSEDFQFQSLRTAEGAVLVRVPQFNVSTIADVTSIELFQFSCGQFVRKVTVDPAIDNTVEIPKMPNTRIFALAAHSIEDEELHSESDFSSKSISMPEDSHSAPVFFSSVMEIHEGTERVDIELRRAVARLDIANSDPDLKIEKVTISGAASSSQIFPMDGRTCEYACASYSREYESGIEGLAERVFILFETATPVIVSIRGRRNGKAVEITTETPAIHRNTIYTVNIEKGRSATSIDRMYDYDDDADNEIAPQTIVRVTDWEEGDVAKGSFDPGESAIDLDRSLLPSGVRINSIDNTITVPADGVSGMRLAFVTREPLKLGSVISDREGVSVTQMASSTSDAGYLSQFRVDVARQSKCASKYQTTIFLHGSSDFFLNIEVDPSPYQIPTVNIGGHEWMCFNAVSCDPEEQIFLPKGMTVEKMYTEHFVECIGNQFQQGRPEPFSPWKAYDPNQFVGQKRDSPWATSSMMPLPKGFHVASMKEWEDLIPSGTVIPSIYTTSSGDSIKASIYTYPNPLDNTPSVATNAGKYLKRCILLESLISGAKLCLPMAGIKTNTSTEIPTQDNFRFDTRSGYWMKEKEKVMLFDYCLRGDGSEGIQLKRNYWHPDGFVMIRGVKD